jgi:RimJ/RimL family protein N-acetyltransferase
MVAVDHVNREAIVAVSQCDGSIVAGCSYVRDPDRPEVAELALTVVDEWHGMGIGTALADEVLHRARDNGISIVIATTLVHNRPARALLRRMGFRTVGSDRESLDLSLELNAYTRPRPTGRLVVRDRAARRAPCR